MAENDELDVREDEEEVAEETTPETDEQATEQRTDDYDGLARRIDDVLDKLDGMAAAIERLESMFGGFVEAGATVREGMDNISEEVIEDGGLNDIVGEVLDEVVSIDDLDLS